MLVEINQRGHSAWAVYVGGEYKGTVSRIGVRQFEFVCPHTLKRYQTRDEAVDFLVSLDLRDREADCPLDHRNCKHNC